MAHYTHILSFLLLAIVFSSLNIEARESKFFNKATNNATPTTTVNQVEPPSPAPSPSELAPVAAPSKEENQSYGYGLYGRSRDEFANTKDTSASTSDTLFESKFPSEEFREQRSKEEFNYKNGLPSNYNEHSYVTVPQEGDNFYHQKFTPTSTSSNYNNEFANEQQRTPTTSNYNDEFANEFANEQRFTPTNYNDEFSNNEVETPEEKDLFKNGYYVKGQNQNAYVNVNEPQKLSEAPKFVEKDNAFNYNNVNNAYERSNNYNMEPQGLSDTRTLENGKYHYALDKPERQPVNGGSYNNNQGYYGNGEQKSKYEFETMEEIERQEGQYIP